MQGAVNNAEIASEAFSNIKDFMEASNMKKTILMYLAAKLPEKSIEDLRELFIKVDINGDGRITTDEFQKSLTIFGATFNEMEMKQLIDKLDTNNNGFIDYTEFLAGCMKSKIYLNEVNLKHAFQYFDKVNLNGV